GLTAPNGPSQERVIRQALANARLEPKDVDAVEAHGTGTTLGDPIEAGALLATYGQDREEPLKLGSIKSNIGHTQAAAGVAGVIKMVEAMRHGVLPRTLHVDQPSSKVDWEAGEIELLTDQVDWQPNGGPRRAGVSSFGISGTNAHVILEEAPAQEPVKDKEEAKAPAPLGSTIALPLSAKSEPALREMAANLASHLQDNPELDPADVGFSLATTRALFDQRAVVLGEDREELVGRLYAMGRGENPAGALTGSPASGKLAYLLTGQGAQRAAMGKQLYGSSPLFAKALDEVCEALDPHLPQPLKDLLFAKEGSKEAKLLDQTTSTQPALFAIEAALFRTLEALGLKPDYLTGHSVGEITAAHISGVLSLEDAAKLVCARASLMGALPKGGAMIAIEATEEEVKAAIEGKEAELSIAAVNGPTSIVISGEEKAALEVQASFEEQGKRTKRLTVSHAFHSPLIEPMLADFAEVAKSLEYQEPKIPILSNLTGEILSPEQAQDPAYWVSHVRGAVRFADGISTLDKQGVTTYLELGPEAVLTAMTASCLPEGSEATLIPTLRKGRGEGQALSAALAQAHASGAKLDWAGLYPGARRVPLPTYPFQRERFWLSAGPGAGDLGAAGLGDADHPLLAAAIEDPEGGLLLTGRISLSTHPWLADHAVMGTVILPGTAFVELALKAGEQTGAETVEELTLQAPLVLPEQAAVSIQVTVSAEEQDKRRISIHSRTETEGEAGEWTLHASGTLSPEAPPAPEPLTTWPPEGAEPIETADLYERLEEIGFQYGAAFQGLTAAWQEGEEIYAEVSLAEAQREEAKRFSIHPALLDAAFHAGLGFALAGEGKPTVPFEWRGVRVSGA
ncbi:MAG TPA: type I polyketide synthase, partial [Nitrospiraceae bacterium]|nr:type I polyketide synthase [Nitrospiraceae bacterium]